MLRFAVYFSRYRNGEVRHSTRQDISGADFSEVAAKADLMLRAMTGADPESRYSIATITDDYATGRVIRCEGARMFETAEELTARLAADKPA